MPQPFCYPSMVSILHPSAFCAAIMQEQINFSSTKIVQAPQSPALHPILVPVNPSSSRRTRENLVLAGTPIEIGLPLSLKLIFGLFTLSYLHK